MVFQQAISFKGASDFNAAKRGRFAKVSRFVIEGAELYEE